MNVSHPASTSMPSAVGVTLLDDADCGRYVAWVATGGTEGAPAGARELAAWSLAHLDDGVTWGRYDSEPDRWRLGHDVAPALSPALRRSALQELRVFGAAGEVLIWRAGGELRGRILRDTLSSAARAELTDPLRPADEDRILRGEGVRQSWPDSRFTHVFDGRGAEQVLPVLVTLQDLRHRRLRVRHYYAADPDTGAARVTATRLVEIRRV